MSGYVHQHAPGEIWKHPEGFDCTYEAPIEIKEEPYHDEDTLRKVRNIFLDIVGAYTDVPNLDDEFIIAAQNAGILFRERRR